MPIRAGTPFPRRQRAARRDIRIGRLRRPLPNQEDLAAMKADSDWTRGPSLQKSNGSLGDRL
jgi:hypothetical protein